jgi:phosphatidylserine/phosphatidylglycerophosphate/cardiolipin synthase-like enzyme
MSRLNPDLRNFLTGALGYLAGTAAGILFVFIAAQLGLVRWLFSLIDENQTLIKLLAIPVFAGLMLALGGAVLGGLGGWSLGSILGISRKRRQVIGSGVAFAVTVGGLSLLFLLLVGFIGIYNNFTTNRFEHFGLVFGVFGLVFGLLTGILQALMSLRLRYTWRLILAATLGFALGGLVMGILVRLVNPTAGFQTYPILTWAVLILAMVSPFALGGGAAGFTYGRLAKRIAEKGETVDSLQPSGWQTGIVAVVGIIAVFWFFGILNQITDFLTIRPGNTQTQIASETVGVQWSAVFPYTPDVGPYEPPPDGADAVKIAGLDGMEHAARCSPEGIILYQQGSGAVEQIEYPGCSSTPAMALDSDGLPHLVWYTTEIRDTNGVSRSDSLLVESIRTANGWSEAAIVARTALEAVPSLVADDQGHLLLVWQEVDQSMYYAVQEAYQCDEQQLSDVELAGLQSILAGGTRPSGARIPYCRNQFRSIIYTPNPEPEFSDQPITRDGAFDNISANISGLAQYEVLFTTMQYEPSTSPPSPGNVLADGLAALYRKVKANPGNYPRGMTVRILLGNYPVVSNLQWGSQIADAIADLRAAGIEKMVDPEIGWRLEVANFPGVYPHSHTKFVVIDGKLVTGVGFNYGYLHLPKDHPSGKGYDLLDLGLSVIGPVAQDTISAYDDMWDGANQIHCDDFYPADGSDWMDTCTEVKGVAEHVPEVLRYYLPPEGSDNAFSLYRNSVFQEGDEFIASSIAAAQETIDMMEVNFSLKMICMVNVVFPDVCTFDDALPWMYALVEAIQGNNIKVRVIMENSNSNGMENRVAGKVLMDELKSRGLDHLVELRFYSGKVHAKSILIDEELLFIGSQNMHYSSWGKGSGLNEYSLATDDPQAIDEYKAFYESKWQESIPFDEAEYSTTP